MLPFSCDQIGPENRRALDSTLKVELVVMLWWLSLGLEQHWTQTRTWWTLVRQTLQDSLQVWI